MLEAVKVIKDFFHPSHVGSTMQSHVQSLELVLAHPWCMPTTQTLLDNWNTFQVEIIIFLSICCQGINHIEKVYIVSCQIY